MSDIENTQNSNQNVAVSQLEETSDSTVTASTQTDKVNSAETPDVPDTHTGGDVSEEDEKPEHTRSKMALLFVLGFFSILFLCIAYAIKVKASLNELKDILVAIIGALSGTLGFIVGFYYKSIKEQ